MFLETFFNLRECVGMSVKASSVHGLKHNQVAQKLFEETCYLTLGSEEKAPCFCPSAHNSTSSSVPPSRSELRFPRAGPPSWPQTAGLGLSLALLPAV